MPIQKIKDPQTGEIREEYVLPTAAPAATPAKPTAKPAAPAKPAAGPTYGIEDIGGIIKDLTQGPSALLQATPGSVSAAAQELVKTGDLGKAFQKGQTTYIKDLEKPGRGAARTIYSAGRNIVQETSDLLTADIPAKLNIPGAKPTTAQRPDAPLFGFLPPLAKPKSSGVAEDLVTGLVQIAIPWAGVSRGVGFAGAALSKLPGAARVGQAATTTAQAVAASKAGQVAARIPGAVPVGKAIAENVATKAAATGAIIDFAAFDQHTGRLTDLIAQTTKGTPLENIAIDYLKSDPKDVGLDGRLKNSLEGLGFGIGVSVVFRLLGAARAARLYKADPTPVKAQQVQQANRNLETELAKQQSAAPPIAQPAQPAVATPPPYIQAPALKDIAEVNPQNIVVDPQRFQYKIAGAKTKTGATGSLEGSTGYNPLYAGTISVWEDPADGITYVVNGHNRLRLAKESNYDKVLVRYLPAETAKQARAMGALQNIAEGQGTAIDAAKFMRDMTADAAALQRQGLSVGGKVTSRAIPLSRLPDNIFDKVSTGALTEDKAIALGSVEGMDPTVINSVAARAEKGKWSADKITQAMQEAKFATASTPAAGGGMLPGFEDFFATSNFDQLLDVRTEAAKALREGVVALSSAARAGRQGVLEAAGNVIDVAGSQAAKATAQQAVNLFDRVTQYEGPVRALLNELAAQVTPKKKAAAIVRENFEKIRAAIDDEANGPRLPFEEPAPEAPRPQPTPVGPEPTAPEAAPVAPSAAEEIVDNVIAAVAPPKTAVQPMGNVAAAAIEPPTTGFALPAELTKSAPRYNYGSKAFQLQFASDYDKTAYILAGDAVKASKAAPKFRAALEQAGLDVASAVAYGQKVRDAIKALARNSQPGVINLPDQGGLTGKTRDEIRLAAAEKTGNTQLAAELRARIAGTNPLDTLRSRGPELPELPKKPGLTQEEIQARIEDIDKLIADLESGKLNMQVDEPATRALVAELTKDIRTVAGDEVAIRFNNAFMETKGGDVAWGYKPGETMKVGGEYDPIKDIIEINNVELISADVQRPELLRLLVDNLEKTAYHEAFHRVQFNFLKPEEIKVFNQYLAEIKLDFGSTAERTTNRREGRPDLLPIEKAAVSFQIYAWARKNNLDPRKALLGYTREELGKKGIVSALESAALAVMDTLYDFVERVGNAFNDRGFISIKSIFEDAYSGKLAKRGELGSVVDEAGKAVPSELDRLDLLQAQAMEYGETRRGKLGLPVLRSQAGPPPPPDEAYTKRFVDQIIENKNKIEAGEITLDDLLVNNVQKFESPSGQTSYVPSPPVNAVQAYRAFSDIFTRPEATGIPVISLETIARETDAWLAKNNYNATAVIEGLQKLSGPLANYEDNLIKLRAGQLYVDDANLKAGIAANKFLNAAADSTADMNQLTADLLTAATYQKAANIALESVTRPIGQLLYSLQGPRPEIGSIEFTQGLPSVKNVGEELEEALDAQAQIPVEESIGKPISPELEEAIVTGEYGPKELEELDQLARSMAQSAVTPGFAKGFWKQVNESAALTTRGLIIYRAGQLLSSGLTLWGNTINNGIRLLQLPVSQALGAGLSGSVPRASQSLMIYGQYVSNLQNAFRLGTESFKAGRGLYDLDETTMDFLDKMVKEDAQLPLDPNTVEGKGEWDLNTMPWVDIQDKSVWAMAQKKIWQGLNLSTRTQVSLDTFFKVLAGQSFEYVRNLQPGLDRAVGQGMDAGSKEAWDFAQEYAQAAVDRATRDVAINGRTILDAVMTSPQAQTAMRYATFTDDIWAQMETRTPTRAQELAAAQGLEGQAATEYINNYLNTTEEIPFFSRTFSMMPAVWQKLINFSPLFSMVQPFNRTPGDIVKSVARMTPAAPLVDTFWRDINSADAFTRDRAKGDIAIGMAAISLGTIAMTQGRVEFTGGGPQEPSAKQKWRESGKVPYSFRVRTGEDENGQPIFSPWVSMRAFEPFSSLFGGMADYQEIANKLPTEARERLGSALTMDLLVAVAGGQLSKSYYQGFAELYEAFTGTGELDQGPNVRSPIERYISRWIASLVPFSSALRAGRRIEDPTVRVVPPSPVEGGLTGIPMRLFEETFNEIRNGIAGWSESLPPRINWITGQPLLLSGILGDEFLPPDQPYLSTLAQFLVLWSPLQVAPKVDPVMAEMTRLSGRGANFRGPTNTDFGKEFRLTPQQFADYSMAAANVRDEYGRNIYMALEQLINSPFYQSLPEGEISTTVPSRRAAAIDREVSIFKALGKTVYLNSRPDLQQELGVIEGRTKQVQYELKYGQPAGLPQFTEALR
jgi:hypothetical protein